MIKDLEKKLSGKLPVTRIELILLISSWGRKESVYTNDNIYINDCEAKECYNLSNLDVSQIIDMEKLFRESLFNGDISKWDVSNVINMERMFSFSNFNGDLSKWNVSKVENMEYMFYRSPFDNNSLKFWNISNVNNIVSMFEMTKFNGDISNWNISNVKYMDRMFYHAKFSGDISKWKFLPDCSCGGIFTDNNEFSNKYNKNKQMPYNNEDFLKWFEENKINIANLNISNEDKLEIDDYLNNFDNIKISNNNIKKIYHNNEVIDVFKKLKTSNGDYELEEVDDDNFYVKKIKESNNFYLEIINIKNLMKFDETLKSYIKDKELREYLNEYGEYVNHNDYSIYDIDGIIDGMSIPPIIDYKNDELYVVDGFNRLLQHYLDKNFEVEVYIDIKGFEKHFEKELKNELDF